MNASEYDVHSFGVWSELVECSGLLVHLHPVQNNSTSIYSVCVLTMWIVFCMCGNMICVCTC